MLPESESLKMQIEHSQNKSNKHNFQILTNKHQCKFNLQCDQQSNNQAPNQSLKHICSYNLRNDKSIINHEATIFLQSLTEYFDQIEELYYKSNKKIIDIIKDYYQVKYLGQNRIKQKLISSEHSDKNSTKVDPQNKQLHFGIAEFFKHTNLTENNFYSTDFLLILQTISDIIQNIFFGDQGVAFFFSIPIFDLEINCVQKYIDPVVCAIHSYQYSFDFVDEQQNEKKQKKEDINICLITLQKQKCNIFKEYPNKLQQINLFVEENQEINQYQNCEVNSANIYNVNLQNLNIDDVDLEVEVNQQKIKKNYISKETIYIVFKQFMKKIIKTFDPKIIIFTFYLEVDFMVDPKVFQFLTQKLARICQSKLIIIPRYKFNFENESISFDPNFKKQKSISLQGDLQFRNIQQSILQSFRGCLRIDKSFTNFIQPTKQYLIYVYESVKQYFVKSKRENIYFQNQLKIFKLTQNIKSNLKLEKSSIKQEQKEQFQFPLINKQNTITLIDIGEIIMDENTQYFVDYQDNLILFIDEVKEFATIIEFNQDFVKTDQYQIDLDFKLKQSTYFFDNQILFKFYGIDSKNIWHQDIVAYRKQQKNWNKVEFKYNVKRDNAKGFITKIEDILELIQDRIEFSVTKNQLSLKALQENCVSLLAVGGHYNNSKIYYQSLFQEFIFNFRDLTYTTKLFQKQYQDYLWKECANPFVHTQELNKIFYFEGQGKYSNISPESKILELRVLEGDKIPYILQKNDLTSTNINLFRQSSHLFSSKHMNVKKGKSGFLVLLINIDKQKQRVVDESCLENLGKQTMRTFQLFKFSLQQSNQQTKQIIIHQETFFEKIEQSFKYEKNQCLHLNWLQNLNNSIFFHLDQNRKQYLLYFRDSDNLKTSKRFVFDNQLNPHEPMLYPDYEEVATVDWIKQQLIVARRQTNQEINIFYCPFVNLQDVKDTKDDIMTTVQMNFLKVIPLDNHTQLISISIHEQYVYIITTTLLIRFPCDLKEIEKIEKIETNQILYNSQNCTTPFKFLNGLLGFFYSEGISSHYYKQQNAIVFKYFYQDAQQSTNNRIIFKDEILIFVPGVALTPDSEATITSILSENFEILIQVTLTIKNTLHYYQLRCEFQTKIHIRNHYDIQLLEGVKAYKSLVGNQSKDFIAYLDSNYERCGL